MSYSVIADLVVRLVMYTWRSDSFLSHFWANKIELSWINGQNVE